MGLALVLVYIAFNLLSPGDMFPSLVPYRPLAVLAVATVPLTFFARITSPEIGKLRTQLALVILFFGFVCCSWFPHGGLRANLTAFENFSPVIIVYFLGVVHLRTPGRLRIVRAILLLVGIYVIYTAHSQFPMALVPDEDGNLQSTPYVLTSGDATNPDLRIHGLGMLDDPNIFGQFLLLILPLLFVSKKDTGFGAAYFVVLPAAAVLIWGVYLTGSRGAEIGFAVLITLFFIHRFKKAGKVIAVIFAPLSLVLIKATSTRNVSMAGGMDRLAIWSDGMAFFKSSPLWGIGFGGFIERDDWTAHNSYLLCAAELGLIGFFLWMGIMVVTIMQLNRVALVIGKTNPAMARWATGLKISLGGFLFTSFFLSCTYSLPLYLLLGMSGAVITVAGGDDTMPVRETKWQMKAFACCVGTLTLIYIMLRLRVF